MAHSTRTIPLVIASVIAVTLVGGAYVLSGPIPFIDRVTAQSSEELLRQYAVKDTDSDGLADWQETLYGTDPENQNSFRADLLDGEAAQQGLLTPKAVVTEQKLDIEDLPGANPTPESLTEQFSQKFLAQYLLTRGNEPPTQEAMLRFVNEAVADLAQTSAEGDSYDARDVRINQSQTLTAYAVEAERILNSHDPKLPKHELEYLKDAVEGGDMTGLDQMKVIGNAYLDAAEELMELPVTSSMQGAHLASVNAVRHMGTALVHMSIMEQDPILTLLGIGEYMRAADEYRVGYTGMANLFLQSGQTIAPGTPGYEYYETAQRAAATPPL